MPRFVVLEHTGAPRSSGATHWDFMFERSGVLMTWALEKAPDSAGEIAAKKLPDHRMAYLEFEGPLSQNRGEVTRWDEGEYELLREDAERMELPLCGARLQGIAVLAREGSEQNQYRFTFSPNMG